ncbi:hypothetical protein BIY29_14655 [Brenneria alni]|uniref:Uncharacterized protein n=1 Tax=Brenneria alni TaxID=71656 RepID=A0A421DLA2_9GAMM|nr:hypothetical protein [Brenneria alni]RLM20820.1 hypothetical protein BIY29_14655 [Brenneria alni]
MSPVQASTFHEAEELIKAGIVKKIKLSFDISGDDFFQLAMMSADRGGKILRQKGYFIISMKKMLIPQNTE